MTAAARRDPGPHPLALGASPAVIRQWLLPDDAARFVAAYEVALDDARTSLDLAGVHAVVERQRGIAILQTDASAYRRTMRLAAELATGAPSPGDEPLEIITSKAGLQPMYVVETDDIDDIDASIASLPGELLDGFAELQAALEVGCPGLDGVGRQTASYVEHPPSAGFLDGDAHVTLPGPAAESRRPTVRTGATRPSGPGRGVTAAPASGGRGLPSPAPSQFCAWSRRLAASRFRSETAV